MYISSTELANRLEILSAKTDSSSVEELKSVTKDLVILAKDAIESLSNAENDIQLLTLI